MLRISNNDYLTRFVHGLVSFQISWFVFRSITSPWFVKEPRVFLCQISKGYTENVSFIPGRAATPKKESLTKSTTFFMSLGAMTCEVSTPVTDARHQKIDLVIIESKAVFFIKNRILEVLSFRFLNT